MGHLISTTCNTVCAHEKAVLYWLYAVFITFQFFIDSYFLFFLYILHVHEFILNTLHFNISPILPFFQLSLTVCIKVCYHLHQAICAIGLMLSVSCVVITPLECSHVTSSGACESLAAQIIWKAIVKQMSSNRSCLSCLMIACQMFRPAWQLIF